MKVIPASFALADFGVGSSRPLADLSPAAMPQDDETGPQREVATEEEELSARLSRAFEEGVDEGRRQAEAAFAAERQKIEERHGRELAARERQWREETGRMLAERLRTGLEDLERVLGVRLADILAPVLKDAAMQAALRRLREELHRMLALDEGLKVRVSGPREMLDALAGELGEVAAALSLEPEDGAVRLVMHVDNTVIETAVEEWAAAVFPRRQTDEAA